MTPTAIQVENLSKLFHIGLLQKRHDTFTDAFNSFFSGLTRRNHRAEDDDSIWALKDISFNVRQGEAIGLIGRNGAGKSTLLKVLSRITEPTSGRAVINGRVGSLLEVATGFHPELTGRENIYLNGAILGMKRAEINRKFDQIVDFAEIEKFLDTPVKRYSSGMYVRLAFAVAAHLEPEILLIDEVLAVGDAAFQKKCLGKMGDVTHEGRTVLFVSHNMGAVQRLCPRSILLEKGRITAAGDTSDVVPKYLSQFSFIAEGDQAVSLNGVPREGIGGAKFVGFHHRSPSAALKHRAYPGGPLEISLDIESDIDRPVSSVAVTFYDEYGTKLVNADTIALDRVVHLKPGMNRVRVNIEQLYLAPGFYNIGMWVANPPGEVYDWIKSGINVEVIEEGTNGAGIRAYGMVMCKFDVAVERA